jgi:hypothetical protein
MRPTVIIAALSGALVGAGLWALIGILTGYEIGFVAWAVGGLVGGAAAAAGGRGPVSGGTAVALTIAAICAGKAIALDPAIDQGIEELFTEDTYAELMADAEAYPGSGADDDALSTFIVDHSYGESGSEEEMEDFLASWGPRLEEWKATRPSFEAWRNAEAERAKAELFAGQSWFDRYRQGFGLFDLIFIALGVTTAFKLAGRPGDLLPMGGAKGSGMEPESKRAHPSERPLTPTS